MFGHFIERTAFQEVLGERRAVAAGMSAVQAAGGIQRCCPDVHTITRHVIPSTGRFEVIRRGLPW